MSLQANVSELSTAKRTIVSLRCRLAEAPIVTHDSGERKGTNVSATGVIYYRPRSAQKP